MVQLLLKFNSRIYYIFTDKAYNPGHDRMLRKWVVRDGEETNLTNLLALQYIVSFEATYIFIYFFIYTDIIQQQNCSQVNQQQYTNVKVKLSLCLINRHHAEKESVGEWELEGGEWSSSRSGHFILGESAATTH
jgi:hypothetical protein